MRGTMDLVHLLFIELTFADQCQPLNVGCNLSATATFANKTISHHSKVFLHAVADGTAATVDLSWPNACWSCVWRMAGTYRCFSFKKKLLHIVVQLPLLLG